MILVHRSDDGLVAGRIVETEAYISENDPACHAHRGKTQRNASMFAAAGVSYIYLIYGIHYCFNVVTARAGVGEAVLIRAVEPLFGLDTMRKRRGKDKLYELCSGPGRLAQAFNFDRSLDGSSLIDGPISIHRPRTQQGSSYEVVASPRIGISLATDLHLRFFIKGNRFVSQ